MRSARRAAALGRLAELVSNPAGDALIAAWNGRNRGSFRGGSQPSEQRCAGISEVGGAVVHQPGSEFGLQINALTCGFGPNQPQIALFAVRRRFSGITKQTTTDQVLEGLVWFGKEGKG